MKSLISEFEEQSFTQIIFPHKNSDWIPYLKEAQKTFEKIINTIIKYQKCLVICDNLQKVKKRFTPNKNLFFVEYQTNDTWARDTSALCIKTNKGIKLLNFTFNGWGSKFTAQKDNSMSKALSKYYSKPMKDIDFILEGGAIQSNSKGIILTTSKCMLNKNRNKNLRKSEISKTIKKVFNAKEILYLNHGYLAGDDTDSHIDTLARFINKKIIMYVKCKDKKDEHFKELKLMENELKNISKKYNFKLIALPMTSPIYYKKERLPATYANFLFVNGAVLVPIYGIKEDKIAIDIFKKTFKNRDIIPINCSTLIKQHGSLHCVTMNFAKSVNLII